MINHVAVIQYNKDSLPSNVLNTKPIPTKGALSWQEAYITQNVALKVVMC